MKILITCPRAPVAIEWIRIFSRAGHEVILVDSISLPIAKYYKKTQFVKVSSPRFEFEAYKKQMIALIEKVDWVIPNCEDIFFLSKVRDSIKTDTFFFMPKSKLLFELHNKFEVQKYINEYVKSPETKLLTDKGQIELDSETILKPLFSRFGSQVIRDVSKKSIEKIELSKEYPWVQQQKIKGQAICNYALILNGEVLAHSIYRPKYLINGAAASYFEPCVNEKLEKFMVQFAKESNYTGQVAFDFIESEKKLYLIECNPRATSGLHILSENLTFEKNTFSYKGKESFSGYRVGVMLYVMFGFKAMLNGEFKQLKKDYKRAKDVLGGLSIFAQGASMLGIFKQSIAYKTDLTTASTIDIEFNG